MGPTLGHYSGGLVPDGDFRRRCGTTAPPLHDEAVRSVTVRLGAVTDRALSNLATSDRGAFGMSCIREQIPCMNE